MLTPTRLAKIAAAADAGATVTLRDQEVRELLRAYRKAQTTPKSRREPVIVGDLAQVEVTITVPAEDVGRYTHKGGAQIWAYDLTTVAATLGISEARARRIARGDVEGMRLRPGQLGDVLALYDALRRPQAGGA